MKVGGSGMKVGIGWVKRKWGWGLGEMGVKVYSPDLLN